MNPIVLALALASSSPGHKEHAGQMTNDVKIQEFEQRVRKDSTDSSKKFPAQIAQMDLFTRFYIMKPDNSVMAIFKKPTSGVDLSLYDAKSHVVEDFSMLPVGGNCNNTLYVNAKQFPHGDYTITCGAR